MQISADASLQQCIDIFLLYPEIPKAVCFLLKPSSSRLPAHRLRMREAAGGRTAAAVLRITLNRYG